MKEDIFEYKVEFSKRKSIGIIINEKCEVIIKAPYSANDEIIKSVIDKKKHWILQKLNMFKEREHLEKDEVLYLGNVYKIKVIEQKFLKKGFVYFDGKTFLINVSDVSKASRTLEKWFRERCYAKILELINKHKEDFSLVPKEVKVKEQKSKWGSCTFDNRIFFNWRLIMAREEAVEYVVVHEMCHMIHKNHSKDFWREVSKVMPEFKEEGKYLKEKGYLMKLD